LSPHASTEAATSIRTEGDGTTTWSVSRRTFLRGVLAAGAVTGLTVTGDALSASGTPAPDPGGVPKPFLPTVWRTRIGDAPTLSPQSDTFVDLLGSFFFEHGAVLNADSYTPTRYIVHGGSFSWPTIEIYGYGGTQSGSIKAPIPSYAICDPTLDGDHEMVVWDVDNDIVWEFFAAANTIGGRPTDGRWQFGTYATQSTSTGTGVFTRGDRPEYVPSPDGGLPPAPNTVSASGLSYLGGLVTVADIAAGSIDHALCLAVPMTNGAFVAPATAADGDVSHGIPEGTRLFYPSWVSADYLTGVPRLIFEAIQTYGMYLVDTAGAIAIYLENGQAWTASGLRDPWASLPVDPLRGFPGPLQVLAPPR
jgi:hypothetical protein